MTTSSNWARRYGASQRRLCARPGCGAPAAATLRFQPTQREAWLVDLEGDGARTEGDLCARHAAGLVLPRGWHLHNGLSNRRDDASDQGPPPAPRARRTPAPRRPRRPRPLRNATALPGLSAVPDEVPVVAEPADPPAPTETTATAPAPAPGPSPAPAPPTPNAALSTSEAEPDTAETRSEPEPEVAPLVAPASAEEHEALAETLDAQTPLLRRAFRNVQLP